MKGASSLFKALFGGFWVLLFLFSITMQSCAEVPLKGGPKVPTIQWIRQFGSLTLLQLGDFSFDEAVGVSVHSSGVYVTGRTQGALPGQTSAGSQDAFVRKYDLDGNEVWTRQFGTSRKDEPLGVSVHGSGVYVAGHTDGTLPGQTRAGEGDVFVRKYDIDGNEVWTRQFGSSGSDWAHGVSVDGSGVYVAGETHGALPGQTFAGFFDAFVRKYDLDGNEVWTHQFGTSTLDRALGISADASGVYVAGHTRGGLPGQTSAGDKDAFVVKITDVPPVLTVPIDIKPGSFPNSINLGSKGTVPLAILSSAAFDATKVDPLTVTLASAPVKLKNNGTPMSSFEDVDGDGLMDMVVHVSTQALKINVTDTEAVLKGKTFDGTPITGRDSVKIVP